MLDAEEKRTIRSWVHRAVVRGTYRHFDDLHINEIFKDVTPTGKWLAAVECLEFARSVLSNEYPEFVVAAGFSLKGGPVAVGPPRLTGSDLESECSITPPSLYIFRRDDRPWSEANSGFFELPDFDSLQARGLTPLYLEYREELEPDFRRSLWITDCGA